MRKISLASFLILAIILLGMTSTSMSAFHPVYYTNTSSEDTKTIVVGTTESIAYCLDIAKAYDLVGWNIISCLSSGLVEIKPGSIAGSEDIIPGLAESWNASGDGKIWDFYLREGVIFEDKSLFNASVVKYTFDRNCNLTGEGLLEPDGPQLTMEYDSIIDNVTIMSEYVVRFYLKISFAPFLQILASPPSFMVDPNYAPMDQIVLYSEGNPRLSHPCGLGPYLLDDWSRVGLSDIEIHLIANPYYWDNESGMPNFNEIVIKVYQSDTALAAAMTTNEIDIAFNQLTANQIQTFMNTNNIQVFDGLGPQIQYLCFNQAHYPFNETCIRQAIAAALDRPSFCSTIFQNQKEPLYSIIPPNLEYHSPTFTIYGDANYTFSRSCLELYGYDETHKLQIDLYYETSGHYPQSEDQALVYKMQLEATGVIDVTLHGLDWPSYRFARNDGTMPVFIYGWSNDYPDADNYAFLPFAAWLYLGYNATYPQGGVDQYSLWLEGRTTIDDIEREQVYYELQELQAKECSIIPLWQGKQFAVACLEVQDIVLDITGFLRYWLLDVQIITGPGTTNIPTTSETNTLNTTESELPIELITLIGLASSVGVIIIVVLVIIRSRHGGG